MANWDAETSSGELPITMTGSTASDREGGRRRLQRALHLRQSLRRDRRPGGADRPDLHGGELRSLRRDPMRRGSARRSYMFNNIFGSTDYPTSNGYLEISQPGGGVYNNTIVGVSNNRQPRQLLRLRPKRQRHHCRVPKQPAQHVRLPHRRKARRIRTHVHRRQPRLQRLRQRRREQSFTCNNNYYTFAQFRSWRFCVNADRHSRRSASARLDERGAPERGSPVIGAGVNLTYLCKGPLVPLCTDIAGVRRPKRGPWNAGAY